jgi:hypothetical protein
MRGHIRRHGKKWQWIIHTGGKQRTKYGVATKIESEE